MKILLYCKNHRNAFGQSIKEAARSLKYDCALRNPEYWRGETEKADVVFVQTGGFDELVKTYSEVGTPVFVFDWGYLHRVNVSSEAQKGHWQVSHGGLNQIPPFKCPSGRFDALGLEIAEKGGNPDGYVLLIGQMPNDKAVTDTNHAAWLKSQAKSISGAGERVVYREHPRGGVKLASVETHTGTLAKALAGAKRVVCYNSNTGHEALLAGVPVDSHSSAAYFDLWGAELPSIEDRQAYFNRLAYGQWKPDEAAQMLRFVSDAWIPFIKGEISTFSATGTGVVKTETDETQKIQQSTALDRAALEAEAKELGVKGVISKMKDETLIKKVRQAKAAGVKTP